MLFKKEDFAHKRQLYLLKICNLETTRIGHLEICLRFVDLKKRFTIVSSDRNGKEFG